MLHLPKNLGPVNEWLFTVVLVLEIAQRLV